MHLNLRISTEKLFSIKAVLNCFVCISTAIAFSSPLVAAPMDERILSQLKTEFKSSNSDGYTVKPGGPALPYPADSVLEIGSGDGHGFTLQWLRFQPENERVNVLSVVLNESNPFQSKSYPDGYSVSTTRAQMNRSNYSALLRDIAATNSVTLVPRSRNSSKFGTISYSTLHTTRDFWVFARVDANERNLLKLNWAGYAGSDSEISYAKPRTAVALTQTAVKPLTFEQHVLDKAEREWVSRKFKRDWPEIQDSDYWWVKDRYIMLVGAAGDADALPLLKKLLTTEDKSERVGAGNNMQIYYATKSIGTILKMDVRKTPVEGVGLEAAKQGVLRQMDAASIK